MATFSDFKLSIRKIPFSQGSNAPSCEDARYSSVERVGGYLYVIGRLTTNTSSLEPAIGLLDIRQRKWLPIPYQGYTIHNPRMFLYDDGLYVYAFRDWKCDTSGKVSRFDLIQEEWSYCITAGGGAGKRRYCSGDYLEKLDCFVVFGGNALNHRAGVLLMPERKWVIPKVKGQPPAVRQNHGSCVYQDVIYYYGGQSKGSRLNDGIYLLTFTNRNSATWSLVKSTVYRYLRLSSLTMFPFNGKLLICGGLKSDDSSHRVSMYNPKTQKLEEAHEEAGFHNKFGVGSCAFIVDNGHSFGIFGGHKHVISYHRLAIVNSERKNES